MGVQGLAALFRDRAVPAPRGDYQIPNTPQGLHTLPKPAAKPQVNGGVLRAVESGSHSALTLTPNTLILRAYKASQSVGFQPLGKNTPPR